MYNAYRQMCFFFMKIIHVLCHVHQIFRPETILNVCVNEHLETENRVTGSLLIIIFIVLDVYKERI